MKCAECQADISIQAEPLYLQGELVDADGAPHRLTCLSRRRKLTRHRHHHRCSSCGWIDCNETMDRKGSLHRCLNPECRAWTYQEIRFRGRGRDLKAQYGLS